MSPRKPAPSTCKAGGDQGWVGACINTNQIHTRGRSYEPTFTPLSPRDEMDSTKMKLTFACLSDEVFNSSEYCLVISQNSLSLKNFGVAEDVTAKYRYSDVAGMRYPCKEVEYIARDEDRSKVGTVYINEPPIYSEGPTIATLIPQYGIGRPIEDNPISQKIIKKSVTAISSHLKQDSMENRIKNFNKSLYKLSVELSCEERASIKKVIIPVGIGRAGVDEIWLTRYLPIISAFADDMYKQGREVVLVIRVSYLQHLERRYDKADDHIRSYFDKFRGLPVLTGDELSLDMTLLYEENEEGGNGDHAMQEYIIP